MNRLIAFLLTISLVFGANITNLCTDKERGLVMCTKIYDPVCAIYSNNLSGVSKKTISNRCMACSDADVAFIAPGACESYPAGISFCNPVSSSANRMCIEIYKPVCGYDEVQKKLVNQSNSCFACTNQNILYSYNVSCENLNGGSHNFLSDEGI